VSRAVNASYSRVTVVNGTRRVDLALPATVPLSDVMPQLLRLCIPADAAQEPVTWTLGRVGEASLGLTQSIHDAAIADGEVLELRATTVTTHPAHVEDVRDIVEDAVDESGLEWQSRTTVDFALHLAAFGLAAALLLPEVRQPRDPIGLALAATVAVLALCGGWWADRQGYHRAGWTLMATATLWGGAAGWLAGGFAGWPWPALLASALTAALATAGLARLTTPNATAHLAATASLCAAALPSGVLALSGLDPADGARVVAVLSILVIGVLPRISLTVGGLAGADYRVRNKGKVSEQELARTIRHSDVLLHGSLLAVAVIGVVTGLVLTASGASWDRALGLAIGLGLLLRSRVFSRIPHILPLRVAGMIVLIAQGVRELREDAGAGAWSIAIAVGAATIVVAVSAIHLSEVARARLKQVLNLAEIVVVAATIPLVAGGLGLYAWMNGLIQ